jgi:putative spermidine/putrescine transport system substrate-binding protein
MGKRSRVVCVSLAAAMAGGLAMGATAASADSLTVVSWGGAFQDAQREVYFQPFKQATGVELLEDSYNGGLAKIKSMVDTGTVTWDVVQVEAPELIRGCEEGLFEPIDWAALGGKEQFIDAAVTECGVGTIVWSVVLAYDADQLKDGPKSWADFWDVEKFPGKRALRKGAKFTLEIALMADGVAPDEVYEVLGTAEGVERAFAKLDEIKDHIQWWEAGAQPPEWLASGDVVMTSAYNGRITAANKEGRNFKIVWDGQGYALDSWVVVKGTPNLEAANAFLAFSAKPENQKNLPPIIPYGPTHRDAVGQVAAEVAVDLPTAPANLTGALANDTTFWVDNEEELNEHFTAWAAR